MSLHVLTHPWEVQDLDNGPLVRITDRDLEVGAISALIDELFELVQESGQPNLSLDFASVNVLPSVVVGKLFALDRKLRERGGRLFLCNLNPVLKALLQVESGPECASAVGEDRPPELEDCFLVFVRDGAGSPWRPEDVERPIASCASYEEALAIREQLRQSGRRCIIRFAGETGGGN
jgi:anti-anti-sigma regulatory factor